MNKVFLETPKQSRNYLENKKAPAFARASSFLAEEEGFEPSSPGLPVKRFSRPPHSTTLPPLRVGWAGWVFMPTYKKGVTVKVPPE